MEDAQHSVLAFERCDPDSDDVVVCVANLQDVGRKDGYRVGLRHPGTLARAAVHRRRALRGPRPRRSHLHAEPVPWQGHGQSALFTVPPLTVVYLVPGS